MQHRAKKRLGQNFLIDPNIIQRIIASINPETHERVIEIGPGLGALTKPLLSHLKQLDVIELDVNVIPKLIEYCREKEKLVIHNMDVLKFNFSEFSREINPTNDNKLRIIGNLPYNISTAVLFHLLKHRHVIHDMHFMLQKEVVERIISPAGNKVYGRLSVMIQTYCKVVPLFTVSAQCFRPAPKVESAILRLTPNDLYASSINDHSNFEILVRTAFSQRRKTLKNTLKNLCSPEHMLLCGIEPQQRAEELSVADFVRLHQQIT